jgi:serine/threonine-protein kinase HipA
MSERELVVSVNEQQLGVLRERDDLWSFEYSKVWMVAPQGFDLSPTLSRQQQLHVDGASHRPVQWYFDNLLPEDAMRTVLAQEATVAAEDAFGLLAYFGAESAGSLVLTSSAHPRSLERGLKPLPFAELSQRIHNLPRASLGKDAPKKMSLAGAQHKLLVVFDGEQLFEPLPGTASTHILKPNHLDPTYPASVINEYFCMRLAKAVGLPVPQVWTMHVPQRVYIVERFDRIPARGGLEVQRRHVIDACQLLNKARSFKYIVAQVGSLEQAAEQCREKAAARLALFDWLLFNVLIGNGDNHLKNLSFIVDAAGVHIAPAYDLLSTAAYDTRAIANEKAHWPESRLAIPLGEAPEFGEVRRSHLVANARALGISAATAQRNLDRMLKIVLGKADLLIEEIKIDHARRIALDQALPGSQRDTLNAALGAEMRLLNTVRHIVLADMVRGLS